MYNSTKENEMEHYYNDTEYHAFLSEIRSMAKGIMQNPDVESVLKISDSVYKYSEINKSKCCSGGKDDIILNSVRELLFKTQNFASISEYQSVKYMHKMMMDSYASAINLLDEQIILLGNLQAKLHDLGFKFDIVKEQDPRRQDFITVTTNVEGQAKAGNLAYRLEEENQREVELNANVVSQVNAIQTLINTINNNRTRLPIYNGKCCTPINNKLTIDENDNIIKNDCECKNLCDDEYIGHPLGNQIVYTYITHPKQKNMENQMDTWIKVCIPKLADFTGYFLSQKTFTEYQPLFNYYKNLVYQVYQNYVRERDKLGTLITLTDQQLLSRNKDICDEINKFIDVCNNEILFTKKMGQYWFGKTQKTNIPQWLT